ncbi:BMP family lipoprotein [Peribacillus kribbensis]|uniref:BMP family lipoprotein n=1 Tax=Peribacillus kribbensis TaxID=356658 RepID=UPI00054F9BBA|nr:BMP family ABC transporter substrate-binding protein [Peribacillus kribbensis]
MNRRIQVRKILLSLLSCLVILTAAGCSQQADSAAPKKHIKIGIMLSDAGLGDQSFSDAGFEGLEKARDELGISFDYREIKDTKTYETGIEELVKEGNDLVIGLGFSMQEAIDKVAKKYPDENFLVIDTVSKLPNVSSVTFKEEEGSYLIGLIAGMETKSGVVGFVGGMDVPLIHKFENGFKEGVTAVNPKAKILSTYAGSFDDDVLGKKIAGDMIKKKADYLYPAAGFTGIGVLKQAQEAGVYSFGVDSDQFFLAEKSVVSSMMKRVDVAIYNVAEELVKNGKLSQKDRVLGVKEHGVDIAPIRVISLTPQEQTSLDEFKNKIENGTITVQP